MNKAKAAFINVKNHLKENQAAYVMGGIAVCAIALQQRNRIMFERFLVEKGLDPLEFYNPEHYEELKQLIDAGV